MADSEEIIRLQQAARKVYVAKEINNYIVSIAEATRKNNYLNLGVSTRASLALLRIAQANALIEGRDFVIPEDVRDNVVLVLSHRISASSMARANGYSREDILSNILKAINVPKVSINDKGKN